ncbi:NUDIX domain-containing protein [Dietzia timorensis]|uniref:Nudix hydrolase domain-containing protein n=1 Tax=Dietzia timorensis TaxID=499555 RepID=A0A173LJ42_9ACTN|nr:NUDIX hydrolase [Dietzia timorensis]ANI92295.1 Hypothetical protein BJL86_1518 [Dietzia timorensis]
MIDPDSGYYEAPSSAKVVILARGQVLLCHNPRGEWELPGGRPSPQDRTLVDVVLREVREETGVSLTEPPTIVDAELFWPIPDKQITLVCFGCRIDNAAETTPSHEHDDVRFFSLDSLPRALPDTYRRFIDAARRLV